MKNFTVSNIEHFNKKPKSVSELSDTQFENIFSMANKFKEEQFAKEEALRIDLIEKLLITTPYSKKRLEKKSIKGLEFLAKKVGV